MDTLSENSGQSIQGKISQVLLSNRQHQQALRAYIEDIQSKLAEVEPLLVGRLSGTVIDNNSLCHNKSKT
jgi:hypoxanthine-guanine phosphoribosyltransferase